MRSPVLRTATGLGFVPPLLPTLVDEPPSGDEWIHEIKHDGNRTLLVVDRGTVRAFTRNGHDWSDRYARLVLAGQELGCRSAVIDGEAVVQDERGVSDFTSLRRAMTSEPHRIAFFAFDLLYLDGKDIRQAALVDRREKLRMLLGANDPNRALQFSDATTGKGAELFAAADRMGLEGIVSKRADSRYRSGRSSAWQKTKCMTEGEFVVIGTEWQPGQAPFALLARQSDDGLI